MKDFPRHPTMKFTGKAVARRLNAVDSCALWTGARIERRVNLGCRSVPLDYSNPSAGVAKIALGRYNATGPNRKGSVFVNPGGPGGPGVGLAINAGSVLQQLVVSSVS